MALPHDLRDRQLRSYVETPPAPAGPPDNPTAQQVILVDTLGAALDSSGAGALNVQQGGAAPVESPWYFALVDQTTRAWVQVSPGGRDPTRGAASINTEGLKFTYTGLVPNITPGATATDFVVLAGSPTKTVKVTRVEIVGAAAAVAQQELLLILRSTADSGGTATTTATITAHDPQNPTSGAVLTAYTTSPTTLGASVGVLRQTKYQVVSTTAAAGSAPVQLVYDWGLRNEQCPTLRGAGNLLCLSNNGAATTTSTVYDVAITWTEEPSA